MGLDNYSIQKVLGQGGMATVSLAHDNKFDYSVAIKILNKEFLHNDNIRNRFISEAKKMFKLSHPNIVKVTDLINEDNMVAFVMEYVEGETLKEYLDRKVKLSNDEIKQIFSQMLDAVGYVHEQGLIHRDIKPSNFMINVKGQIKLMDFGIAKNTDTSSSEYTQTGTQQNMGTPMYMSPEQIKSTKDVTSQSDIYSLGVVLWQMVTGKKPYDTETISTWELQTKIVTEPLPKTGTIFDILIENAIEKDIANRIKSINLFSVLFSSITNKEPVNNVTMSSEKTIVCDNEKTVVEVVSQNDLKGNENKYLLVPIWNDGEKKYGLMDYNGKWVLQPNFQLINFIKNDKSSFKVQINDRTGIINDQGEWILQPNFKSIWEFDERGFCAAFDGENMGFIDRKGDWIIEPYYDRLGDGFDERDFCSARVNEKWGFINRRGDWVIKPVFEEVNDFDSENFCKVQKRVGSILKKEIKYGFINRKGDWVIKPVFDDLGDGFDKRDFCSACVNEKWGFINRRGDWVIKPVFEEVNDFDDENFSKVLDSNFNYCFINREGTLCFKQKYDLLGRFDKQNYCLAMKINGKFGFINRQGSWIIDPKFDNVKNMLFEDDYFKANEFCTAAIYEPNAFAQFELIEKWGFVDRNGDWIIKPSYDNIYLSNQHDETYFHFFYEEMNYTNNKVLAKVKIQDKYGLINKEGQWIIRPDYYLLEIVGENMFMASKSNKYGFINISGMWIIDPQFKYDLNEFLFTHHNSWGWEEENQKWVKVEDEEIEYDEDDI